MGLDLGLENAEIVLALAAPDDLVTIVGSREASLALPPPPGPVDHAIVGIVDAVEEWPR